MQQGFTNQPLQVDDLPTLEAEEFVSVDPRYLRAFLGSSAATAVGIGLVGVIAASRVESTRVVHGIAAVLLLLVVFGAIAKVFEVRVLGYLVRERDLSLRSGVLVRRVSSLPFTRVQHVTINRGAIERLVGLATLHVSSAGPNMSIPGVAVDDAERIKLLVTERAGIGDEDAPNGSDAPNRSDFPNSSEQPTASASNSNTFEA